MLFEITSALSGAAVLSGEDEASPPYTALRLCSPIGSLRSARNTGLITGTFFNGRISFSAQIVEPDNVTVCVLAPSTVARTVSDGCTTVYEFNTACLRNDSA